MALENLNNIYFTINLQKTLDKSRPLVLQIITIKYRDKSQSIQFEDGKTFSEKLFFQEEVKMIFQ